ncbi:MAG: hypothetical protein EHM36_04490 [Deltaproteobacteria bacterium]|nr:MAG: hypothetical protein EHM36_04490 [Deltaproteobacteria bacterium]
MEVLVEEFSQLSWGLEGGVANGEPLPRKHGFPLRLVFEDAYGSDWVKYVDELSVL